MLFLPGWISQIEQLWEAPANRHFLERLGAFARLILFDSRGTGLSERTLHTYTLEQETRDALAVLDAAGSERVALFTYAAGRARRRQAGGGAPPAGRCPGDVRLRRAHLLGPGLRLGDDRRAARTGHGPRHLHVGGAGQSAAGAAGAVDGRGPDAAVVVRAHPAPGRQPPRGADDRQGHRGARRPRAAAHDLGADAGDAPPAGAGVGRAPLPLPGREHPRGPLRRAGRGPTRSRSSATARRSSRRSPSSSPAGEPAPPRHGTC